MKVLFVLFFLVSCGCKKPEKFAYKDNVDIVDGFYKGQSGIIMEQQYNGDYRVKVEGIEDLLVVEPRNMTKKASI